jgi:hypothetical protein
MKYEVVAGPHAQPKFRGMPDKVISEIGTYLKSAEKAGRGLPSGVYPEYFEVILENWFYILYKVLRKSRPRIIVIADIKAVRFAGGPTISAWAA